MSKQETIEGFLLAFQRAAEFHIQHGGVCLHSCAVARSECEGFLFLGSSETGKTTIAVLSASLGYAALGDDLNFVLSNNGNGYLLAAAPSPRISPVGYSRLRPTLRSVFKLVQDKRAYIVRLTKAQTASELFYSFRQAPITHTLCDELYAMAFHTMADIARSVPGYELHFRKSADFWDVIDAEFGL